MTDMPIVRVLIPEPIKVVRVLVPGLQGPPGRPGNGGIIPTGGTGNDQPALQAAVDQASSSGKAIYLDGQVFTIPVTQDLPTIGSLWGANAKAGILLKSGVSINGPGKIIVPPGTVGPGGSIFATDATVDGSGLIISSPLENVILDNVEIDGSNVASGTASAITLVNTSRPVVRNCRIHNVKGVGIFLSGDLEKSDVPRHLNPQILNNRVWATENSGIVMGMAIDGLAQGNVVDFNGSTYSLGGVGIGVPGYPKTGGTIPTGHFNKVIGNTIIRPRYGIFSEGSQEMIIADNIVRDVVIPGTVAGDVGYGIRINTSTSASTRHIIHGNQLHSIAPSGPITRATGGMLLHGGQRYQVFGNFIKGFTYGLHLEQFSRWLDIGANEHDDIEKYITYITRGESGAYGNIARQIYLGPRTAGLRSHYLDLGDARWNRLHIIPAWSTEDDAPFQPTYYHNINNTEWNSNLGYSWFSSGETKIKVLTGSLGVTLPEAGEYLKINGTFYQVLSRAGLLVTIRDSSGNPGDFTATTNGNHRIYIYSAADYAALTTD